MSIINSLSNLYMRIREYFRKTPVTFLIILLNTVFLILTMINGGFTWESLFQMGALLGSEVEKGDYYRMLTVIFLHGGILHYAINTYAIAILGQRLESLIGSVRFSFLYIPAGLASSLAIVLFDPDRLTVGASGAIFGIIGIFIYMVIFRKDIISYSERFEIIKLLVLNLIITLIPGISAAGHLGGLVGGFILGFPLLMFNRPKTGFYQ
jgi:rhomboid protease GluP